MFRILDDFQKIYYEPMSLPKNVDKSEPMARIQYSECNHYKDRDTKARDRLRFIVQSGHYRYVGHTGTLGLKMSHFYMKTAPGLSWVSNDM